MSERANPSRAWDDVADSLVSTDEERIQYWRNRTKIESARRIGTALAHASEATGIQRQEVAARMGTQPSAVTRLFAGSETNPTLDTMIGAALATGVKTTVVFELADDPHASPFEVIERFDTGRQYRTAFEDHPGRRTDLESCYASDGDIAYIRVRAPHGPVRSEERDWGLRDYDETTGELVGLEVWEASKVLPQDLVEALPRPDQRGTRIAHRPA